MSKREINLTYVVDELGNYTLQSIPKELWEAFTTESKLHFPDAGEDAPFHYLSSVIAATVNSSSYFLTDVPRENAKAMSDILAQVGWEWENFHVYLLRSAILPKALRIVSMHNKDKKQEFGTLIITGLTKEVFENIEKATSKSLETVMASMMIAANEGTITFSPDSKFYEPT